MTNIDWSKVITAEDKFEKKKQDKMHEISMAFKEHVSGSFVCSLGYRMQFNETDSLKMEGAIQLLIANNEATGYLTDSNDETHYDVPLADIQTVKIEMLSEFAQAHAKKQRIRQLIFASTTEQELEEIQWNAHE